MAFTKAQLEALKNSQLASNQPITAAIHRAFAQNLIDELYDAQSRGNLLAGVQEIGTTAAGDDVLVIRAGQAYLIPASLFGGSGISFADLNGIVIVDPQDGDLLSYDAATDTWVNVPNAFDASNFVNIAGAQSITGAKVFVNAILALTGSNPVFRIGTSDNEAIVNFRNAANEDAAGVVMSTPANEVSLVTRVNNMSIRIQPNGTGGVRFPAVPAAVGAVRMMVLDTNDRLRDGGAPLVQTTGVFTPTLTDSGGGFTYTLSQAAGTFIKTGRQVYVSIIITITSTSGTQSGGLLIGNLPFTAQSFLGSFAMTVHKMQGTNWSNALLNELSSAVNANTSTIGFSTLTSPSGNQAPSITNGAILISGCYQASS